MDSTSGERAGRIVEAVGLVAMLSGVVLLIVASCRISVTLGMVAAGLLFLAFGVALVVAANRAVR